MGKHSRVPMTYKGIYYECRKDAFDAAGLDEKTQERVRAYIKRHKEVDGKDLSVIIELANSSRREKYRTVYGVQYTHKELCNTFNIGKHILDICSDYEIEKLLKPITIFNKTYPNRFMLVHDFNVTIDELRLCEENKIYELIESKLYIVGDNIFSSFTDFCEFVNVNPKNYSQYLLRKGLNTSALYAVKNIDDYINASGYIQDRHITKSKRADICRELGISEETVYYNMRKTGKTFDETVKIMIKQKENGTLRVRMPRSDVEYYTDLVSKAGLKNYNHIVYRARKSNISIEQEICRLNPNCYINDKGELIIPPEKEWVKHSRALRNRKGVDKELKLKCYSASIDYQTARRYKDSHPELTDEQVIMYYRPDCYINLLGELVIPN